MLFQYLSTMHSFYATIEIDNNLILKILLYFYFKEYFIFVLFRYFFQSEFFNHYLNIVNSFIFIKLLNIF